ncbi:DUF257 family protein [Palaeococcus sp. (in: euryarchaeotes)]|nr:MAG: hypothetical protein DRN39_05965 [Thermococci archaeon]
MEEFLSAVKKLKWGDTVLVQYPSHFLSEYLFLTIYKYAEGAGIPVWVDDVLDSLYSIKKRLELGGIDTSFFERIYVGKIGGRRNVGNVLGQIPFAHEGRILVENYKKILEQSTKKLPKRIDISLGMDELFLLWNNQTEIIGFIKELSTFVGEKNRTAYYLINKDALYHAVVNPLPLMHQMASVVLDLKPMGTKAEVNILKASNLELLGRKFEIKIEDILR